MYVMLSPYIDEFVMGEFTCDDSDYPLVICVLDTVGRHWWMDGDYVLQKNKTYNDHPIWHKEGFYLLDYYIYLHTNNNAEPWYWAITRDEALEDDYQIVAKCDSDYNTNNISEPSECPQWLTTDYFNTAGFTEYSVNKNLTVSAEICVIEDEYICIQSNQSSLGMI